MELFAHDDVWNPQFLKCVIMFYDGPGIAKLEDDAVEYLQANSVSYLFYSSSIKLSQTAELVATEIKQNSLPIGPYILSRLDRLHEPVSRRVYRLFEDEYDAFLFGLIPNGTGWLRTNIELPSKHKEGPVSYIPVPSKLSFLSSTLPLAGTRFALKDIYDIAEIPTAAGSIAYQHSQPLPNATAPSVTKLLSLGAVMVGKTRTSQFAHGANPWEFYDFSYSWNPRGDGYHTASSSSSGSACAIAGYSWLDFTVGSDTRGSVRKPASLVGVYGIRPSHGALDLTGVVPLSEEMDTAGFFARDPWVFEQVHRYWYSDSPVLNKRQINRFPPKLLYPVEHFPVQVAAAQNLYEGFAAALYHHLGIQPIAVNMTSMLTPFFPNNSFSDFQLSSNKLAEYRSWTSVGKPIVDYFNATYGDSQYPSFDPVPERMFARGRNITHDEFLDAVKAKEVFRNGVSRHIFKEDSHSCSDSLFMYDAGTGGKPSYRYEELNLLHGATHFLLTVPSSDGSPPQMKDFFNFLASMGELPEVTIPLGQVGYYSHLTRQWEAIPVAVQLVSRKGCDAMLVELVKALGERGVIRGVKVGSTAY
ncbi:amidase signature domain-containing protein [Cyathus striatus]|nr:amidase signature domain-containing protein [Cyathus striatus]